MALFLLRSTGTSGDRLARSCPCPLKAGHGLGRRTRTQGRPARPGTIRGDYALDVMCNVVPSAGSSESGGQQIKFFPELVYPFRAGR